MTKTDIPNFAIVGPQRTGLLDPWLTMGWRWYSPMGLLGEAVQLSEQRDIEGLVLARFLRYGRTWHRRTVVSPEHHLWMTVFRLRGKVEKLERNLKGQKAEMGASYIDVRYFGSWFHVLLLRLFFGYTRPTPEPRYWDDDDD